MWFHPQVLSVIATHRCTAACAHCCFGCSPAVDRSIPLDRLRALVEETAEVPSIRQVVFTGGECFLLGQALDGLIARCTALGLATRCVTNGYWATSPAAAARRVSDLRTAGLGELNLSTGPHHAAFVPWERVVWGAAAALDAGMAEVVINVETFEGSTFRVEEVAGHPALAGRGPGLRILEAPWIPAGGEWAGGDGTGILAHAPRHHRFKGERRDACVSSLQVVSVTPTLDLVTCCGLNLEHIPQLHVASLQARTLAQALEEVPPDLLKMWIHAEGPERVLEFVKERRPGFRLPVDSAHICHTCQFLHHSAEALGVLERHLGEVEERVLEAYLFTRAGGAIAAGLSPCGAGAPAGAGPPPEAREAAEDPSPLGGAP